MYIVVSNVINSISKNRQDYSLESSTYFIEPDTIDMHKTIVIYILGRQYDLHCMSIMHRRNLVEFIGLSQYYVPNYITINIIFIIYLFIFHNQYNGIYVELNITDNFVLLLGFVYNFRDTMT